MNAKEGKRIVRVIVSNGFANAESILGFIDELNDWEVRSLRWALLELNELFFKEGGNWPPGMYYGHIEFRGYDTDQMFLNVDTIPVSVFEGPDMVELNHYA
jgi:hypothetical protein